MAGIVTAGIIGGIGSIASGIFGASSAKKREKAARKERLRLTKKLKNLEDNRQEIINPYAGVTDLTSMLANPMASLSVATGAAEMKIEQADISLANTLDTMRATGGGAGGATALAQAALQSKKDVAVSIETQEKANEDKRAAGEQQLQAQKVAEQKRLQQAEVSGAGFVFGQTENREVAQLDRTAALLGASKQAEGQAQADRTAAITGAIGGVADAFGSAFGPTT
jgi:hypothetical protein|tara:strand:+ start:27 stop:701 length:675 start_codon:yes stop_codon:yes gene_type:complete